VIGHDGCQLGFVLDQEDAGWGRCLLGHVSSA
jgi:hypothetical protein